jgi:uncharacterized repeat protein (TIGR01451 family)
MTVGATAAGILVWGGSAVNGYNNISYFNVSSANANWTGSANLTYTCTTPAIAGAGNISGNPMFADPTNYNYNLTPASPCIDAGNPISPPDPDGTVADMGAFYFNQAGAGNVTVTMTPVNPPIQIPATGGSFQYNISLANVGTTTANFAVWITATLPTGTTYGPIINAPLTLSPGATIARLKTQSIPASAPAGLYSYNAYVGIYPNTVWDEEHFNFTKVGMDNNGRYYSWDCGDGNMQGANSEMETRKGNCINRMSANPNPFNPNSVISFEMRDASYVNLTVFDISGRLVAELVDGWREAGVYNANFSGEEMPSGVYLARLAVGQEVQTQKLLLVK